MLKFGIIVLVATFLFLHWIQEADLGFIEFPYIDNSCTLKFGGVVCCQGIRINLLDFSKTICVDFTFVFSEIKADVNLIVDNNTISNFTIDPTKPLINPCTPCILPISLQVCIRFQDIQTMGIGFLICSSFLVIYDTTEIEHDLPCLKLGIDGLDLFLP